MLVLKDYNNANGDASKIYVTYVRDVTILDSSESDATQDLLDNNVLVALRGGGGLIQDLYGEHYAGPAFVALEIPLYDDLDKEAF